MKHLRSIFLLISFFLLSCRSVKYVESYEPIKEFLETQKIDKSKKHILQADKVDNRQALRIFNGGDGAEHIIDPKNPTDYTYGLFEEKHWKKMYKEYANDTLKKYWKKEDFPEYDFILEEGKGLFKYDFMIRYIGTGLDEAIILSEPMYYMDRKYAMFYYSIAYSTGGGSYYTVIMKKEKNKWIIEQIMQDYIYNY